MATDASELVRNRLWAWVVRALSDVTSWDALDVKWLTQIDGQTADPEERGRLFERIYRKGDDPAAVEGLLHKLLDVMHATPEMAHAKAVYESYLFEIAGPKELEMARLQVIHDELLWRSGYVDMRLRELRSKPQLEIDLPPYGTNVLRYEQCAGYVASQGTIDAIAWACAAFKLALLRSQWDRVELYFRAIGHALSSFQCRVEAPDMVIDVLHGLIGARVILPRRGRLMPENIGFAKRRRESSGRPKKHDRSLHQRMFCLPVRCGTMGSGGHTALYTLLFADGYELNRSSTPPPQLKGFTTPLDPNAVLNDPEHQINSMAMVGDGPHDGFGEFRASSLARPAAPSNEATPP